ncbi:MAG: magnesium transporter CorA family protein [Rhodospirillales bacterium]
MISTYALNNGRLEKTPLDPSGRLPASVLWIDLESPTREEAALVLKLTGVELPTREEMQEIEVSSRLYREGDADFLTAPIIHQTDTPKPEVTPVTFIVARSQLITVRYAHPRSIDFFVARAARQIGWCNNPETVLMGLLETIVDRVADVMERVAAELDATSRAIFYDPAGGNGPAAGEKTQEQANADLRAVLRQLGRAGDLTTKTRDTILGLDRVATYIIAAESLGVSRETKPRLKTLTRDIRSLAEHDGFLSNKVNFMLDATLGMISIEQNRSMTEQSHIIKIFTVAATAFLPPTLVASIYGMNFAWLPELKWGYGYLWALGLMVLSAVLPLAIFRRRGWL